MGPIACWPIAGCAPSWRPGAMTSSSASSPPGTIISAGGTRLQKGSRFLPATPALTGQAVPLESSRDEGEQLGRGRGDEEVATGKSPLAESDRGIFGPSVDLGGRELFTHTGERRDGERQRLCC